MKHNVFTILILFSLFLSNFAFAQSEEPLWLRYTTISPDGSEIAFTYKGNAYKVPATGGDATILVSGGDYTSHLQWSPNGETIAMSIKKYSNTDVYTIPADGGNITRMTWHQFPDIVHGFSKDSNQLIISSHQLSDEKSTFFSVVAHPQFHQFFSIPVAGGKMKPFFPYPALQVSLHQDNSKIVYANKVGIEQKYRKHQKSAASPAIYIYDIHSQESKRITDERVSALNPIWANTGYDIYYLSEKSGSFNIWHYDAQTGNHEQITTHSDHPVRHLSIAANTGDMVYSYNGQIYLLKNGTKESVRVQVNIRQTTLPLYFPMVVNDLTQFDVNAQTQEVVIASYGDIFLLDGNNGSTKQLLNTPYEERDPVFTPDGKNIIFSAQKENGMWGIYALSIHQPTQDKSIEQFSLAEQLTTTALITGKFNATNPIISPNGEKIAYLYNRDSIFVYDIKSQKSQRITSPEHHYSYSDGDLSFSWSPDSAYILTTVMQSLNYTDIYAFPVTSNAKEPLRLTYNGSNNLLPKWHPDGNSVLYASSVLSKYQANGTREQSDVFQQFLSRAAYHDTNSIQSDKENNNSLRIERGKISDNQLLRRVTQKSTHILFYAPVLQGQSLFTATVETLFDGSQVLKGHLINMQDGSASEVLSMPVEQIPLFKVIDNDGSALMFFDGVSLNILDFASGELHPLSFSLKFTLDIAERIKASFDQFWIFTKQKIYDPKMGGVDWDKYGNAYRRFLNHVDDPEDVADILSEMVGELNVSHTRSSYSAPEVIKQGSSLGLIYNMYYTGEGYQVAEVLEEGPFDRADVQLQAGDIIIAIDNEKINKNRDINQLLINKLDTTVAVRVKKANTEETWVEYIEPIESLHEYPLLQKRWVKKRRDYVVEKSNGKLGYVFIPQMDEASFQNVVAESLGRFRDADGLIVDVRFNLGGFLHDSLVTFLTGKKYMYFKSRAKGSRKFYESSARWNAPSVVLANADSYSDGSVFPKAYQDLQIGQVVGEPIPGTGTAVWWRVSNIIPGLEYGIPQLPAFSEIDDSYYENQEIIPNKLSYITPKDVIQDKDPQLDAAIEVLLSEIRNK